MASQSRTLSDNFSLGDTFETEWDVSKTYSESINLDDGDKGYGGFIQDIKLCDIEVSNNGGYISIVSTHNDLSRALKNLTDEMELQSCPISQTRIIPSHDGTDHVVAAIVKRH